jgi:hypothetical protein
VFEDDSTNWWSWMLKPGIRHCYVVKLDKESIVVLEKTKAGLSMFTMEDEKSIIGNNSILISYKAQESRNPLFMLNTCVGHTKQILGINKPFILTPYQLLKYLRKQ